MTPPRPSLTCEAFRESYEPAADRGPEAAADEPLRAHRASCPSCRRYAAALGLAASAGTDRPLPPRLEARLRAVARRSDAASPSVAPPSVASSSAAAPPVPPAPRRPMPPGLEGRLRAIARQPRSAPDFVPLPGGPAGAPTGRRRAWYLESAAASVAASLLLVVLLGALWGNPVTTLRPRAERLALQVSAALEDSRADGRSLARQVIVPARQEVERRLVGARRSLERISVEIGPGPAGEAEAP